MQEQNAEAKRSSLRILAMSAGTALSGCVSLLSGASRQKKFLVEPKAHHTASGRMMQVYAMPYPNMVPGILEPDPREDRVWFVAGGGGFAGFMEPPLNHFGSITPQGELDLYQTTTKASLPSGIAPTTDKVAVTEYKGNNISVFDRRNGGLSSYRIPTQNARPTGVCWKDERLIFCENAASKIGILYPDGRMEELSIPTPRSRPTGIVALPGDTSLAMFSELYGNRMGILHANSTIRELDVPIANARLTYVTLNPENSMAVACARGANALVTVALEDYRVQTVSVPEGGEAPFGIAFSDRNRCWVALMQSNEVITLDMNSPSLAERIPMPVPHALPGGVAITRTSVWTSLHGANAIVRISL